MGDHDQRMKGRVCMVTGATSGIGKVTALSLADQGAKLVIVGRNRQKTLDSVDWIRTESGNDDVQFLLADFSDLDQIRDLAKTFATQFPRLDLLVNNAGAFFNRRRVSASGVEMTFLVNHLAPFLLTNLLLETIRKSSPARIVNVSSDAHKYDSMDFDDLSFSRGYFGFKAYARSKLANVLFTRELARRLDGSRVTVNAVHPGHVATDIWRSNFGFIGPALKWFTALFSLTPEQGAEALIHVASSPEVEGISGTYFDRLVPSESSELSRDQDVAGRLWELSESLTSAAS